MELFFFIVLLALWFFQYQSLSNKIDTILNRTFSLETLLYKLQKELGQSAQEKKQEQPEIKVEPISVSPKTDPVPQPEPEPQAPELPSYLVQEIIPEEEILQKEEIQPAGFQTLGSFEVESLEHEMSIIEDESEPEPVLAEEDNLDWMERFKRNNPDMERFIGENLISKIGIAILVLGIAFFVKYAIDQNWINETARVGIGILAGAIVLGFAHRLKAEFKAFSSVLVSGGISIFYFTLAIGFQEYHLYSQPIAFAMMVLVTAFSVLISISYNRQELAVLSLIGGFVSPFLLSTSEGNYIALFTYLIILDMGMLVLSYFRNWFLVNGLTYAFTILIFAAWFGRLTESINPQKDYGYALLFSGLFYLIFLAATLINQIKEKRNFKALELSLLLSNTFLFFTCGMISLGAIHPEFKGLFTIGLAAVNLLVTLLVRRSNALDQNLFYLLIGLVLTFVTLAVPIQLSGHYITLFWAAETCLLLWLAQKSKIQIYRMVSVLIMLLCLLSLVMDWQHFYDAKQYAYPLFNVAFFNSAFVILCLFGYRYLLVKEEEDSHSFYDLPISNAYLVRTLNYVLLPLVYLSGFLELNCFLKQTFIIDVEVQAYLLAYHLLFSLGLFILLNRFESANKKSYQIALGSINVLLFALLMPRFSMGEYENFIYKEVNHLYVYAAHYLSFFAILYQMYRMYLPAKAWNKKYTAWFYALGLCVVLSEELYIQVNYFFLNGLNLRPDELSNAMFLLSERDAMMYKSLFPILWGLLAFALLTVGIKQSYRDLRIAALVLIGVTIAKLFLIDIRNVSEGGKIAAFILLGLLLLIISFTYQKIKLLILEEKEEEKVEENEEV